MTESIKDYFYTNVFQRGNKIYVSGYANGKRFNDDIDYKPYVFLLDANGPYKTVDGYGAVKKQFESIKDARDFIKTYQGVDNFSYYGLTNWQYVYMNDDFPGIVDYNLKLISVVSIDIEVSSKNGMPSVEEAKDEVTAITLTKNGKIVCFGTKHYKPKNPAVQYFMCRDEVDLLKKFLFVWNCDEWRPDVVTGWYIENFDVPYMVNRIRNVLGDKAANELSPWKIINEREITRGKSFSNSSKDPAQRVEKIFELVGITQLDYIQLYKKFTASNHESYRLNHIAEVELGEHKLDYSEYDSLDELYEKNPEKYYDYNILDAVLVEKLEKKLGFINLVLSVAYKAKINFIDAMTTVKPWDIIIHNYLMDKKIVIPQQKSPNQRELIGAFVKEPQVGLHKHVAGLDFEGLYPRMISQHNISPETLVATNAVESWKVSEILEYGLRESLTTKLKENNWSLCANKCTYTRDKRGFLAELVDDYIATRKLVKNKMLDMQKIQNPTEEQKNEINRLDGYQQAIKILTNGLYGALGNKYFRWFDVYLAESVTTTGQLYEKWVIVHLNAYLNKLLQSNDIDYIIAGDTDSIYVNLDPIVQKICPEKTTAEKITFMDNLCQQKISPKIEEWCKQLADQMNSYNFTIVMKREALADKAIWRAAKNYIINVWDNEGVRYKEPKIKMKGIEAVRSSTPMVCRNKIKDCLKIIMNGNEKELQLFIKKFYEEYQKLPVEDISFPRSVDGLEDYYDPLTLCKKATPIHVRGVLIYNEFIKALGVEKKYPLIKNKEKIKFVYLKLPNPFKSHVIGFSDTIDPPKQMPIAKYVDRDLQWEKTFLSPIKSITDVIGWSCEKKATLAGVFFKK